MSVSTSSLSVSLCIKLHLFMIHKTSCMLICAVSHHTYLTLSMECCCVDVVAFLSRSVHLSNAKNIAITASPRVRDVARIFTVGGLKPPRHRVQEPKVPRG